jgi:ubiquinone/menaquinone biosynthesis C-methylase UbiE
MYQDANLADRRNYAEKETVLPRLNLRAADRVLDVGCGSGRWAKVIAPNVGAYLGIDFSPSLLEVARTLVDSAEFQCVPANSLDFPKLKIPPPFTLFICSGILTYLNDGDVLRLFATVLQTSVPGSRIYIREPIAKTQRLTQRCLSHSCRILGLVFGTERILRHL